MRFIKILSCSIVITLTICILYNFLGSFPIEKWSSLFYQTDYLINYEGGFVRRGLDGEIIFYICKYIDVVPWLVVRIYNLIFFISFLIILIYSCLKFRIPLFPLLSMGCLLLYFNYAVPLRKDHLVLLILMALELFLIQIKKKKIDSFIIAITNIVFIIASLQHELFYLISIFPVILIFYIKFDLKENLLLKLLKLFLLPTILFISLSTIFKGDLPQKLIIIDSWKQFQFSNVNFSEGIFESSLYIWKYNHSYLSYIYLVVVIILHLFFIFISSIHRINNQLKDYFIILLSLQYLIALLLCFVAIDFARWFFMASFTSIYTIFLIQSHYSKENYIIQNKNNSILLSLFLYLVTTLPFSIAGETNIKTYIDVLPINIIINTIFK